MSRSWLGKKDLRRVTVHTHAGQSFTGCIAEVASDGLLLRSATLLGEPSAGQPDTDLTGETWLPREGILFIQGA